MTVIFMNSLKINVNNKSSVYANLHNTLRIFSSLDGVLSLDICGELLLSDNGVDSAYENYALISPYFAPEQAEATAAVMEALRFFAKRERAHLWPIFPGVSPNFTALLDKLGIKRDSVFYSMDKALEPGQNMLTDDSTTVKTEDDSDAHEWADAVWYGFDSNEAAPASFVSFAKRASKHKDIILTALRSTEPPHEMTATGMLTLTRDEAGIYYIATHPDFRRRGFAAKVMNSLFSHAQKLGYAKVCLLATPDGRDFYKRIGFVEREEVEIRLCENPSVLLP